MKIEKLTENKIRVIINSNDLEEKNIDSFISKAFKNQDLFFDILQKAEKEVDFNTEGCKLLIEAFPYLDDFLIFTITKYLPDENQQNCRKKLYTKRKDINIYDKQAIYSFDNFDTFYDFCNYIRNFKNFNIKSFAKNISLYLYKNTYYLVIKNIQIDYDRINTFYSNISEFAKFQSSSKSFEFKLIEHGKLVFKNNAILLANN